MYVFTSSICCVVTIVGFLVDFKNISLNSHDIHRIFFPIQKYCEHFIYKDRFLFFFIVDCFDVMTFDGGFMIPSTRNRWRFDHHFNQIENSLFIFVGYNHLWILNAPSGYTAYEWILFFLSNRKIAGEKNVHAGETDRKSFEKCIIKLNGVHSYDDVFPKLLKLIYSSTKRKLNCAK